MLQGCGWVARLTGGFGISPLALSNENARCQWRVSVSKCVVGSHSNPGQCGESSMCAIEHIMEGVRLSECDVEL